jgi:hypothetical protein
MSDYVEVPIEVPTDPGGGTVKLYVEARRPTGEQMVSAVNVEGTLDDVTRSIRYVAASVGDALRAAAPSRSSLELGFEVKVEAGKLVALLAHGGATATIKVTLEWEGTAGQPA